MATNAPFVSFVKEQTLVIHFSFNFQFFHVQLIISTDTTEGEMQEDGNDSRIVVPKTLHPVQESVAETNGATTDHDAIGLFIYSSENKL